MSIAPLERRRWTFPRRTEDAGDCDRALLLLLVLDADLDLTITDSPTLHARFADESTAAAGAPLVPREGVVVGFALRLLLPLELDPRIARFAHTALQQETHTHDCTRTTGWHGRRTDGSARQRSLAVAARLVEVSWRTRACSGVEAAAGASRRVARIDATTVQDPPAYPDSEKIKETKSDREDSVDHALRLERSCGVVLIESTHVSLRVRRRAHGLVVLQRQQGRCSFVSEERSLFVGCVYISSGVSRTDKCRASSTAPIAWYSRR